MLKVNKFKFSTRNSISDRKIKKPKMEFSTRNSISDRKIKKPKMELLGPAGDFASLRAGIEAGADAIYFGLKEFSMRDRGKNFKISDLPKIKKLCQSGSKKVKRYLTLNTIIYDSELSRVEKIIKKAKTYVDAIICWDLAVIELCRKHKIEFHISTQASISNIESARFYKKLGATRVVLARELSLKQIKKISKIIDVEVFGHGAMCVSVSGRCFTSQFLFGKENSANRGRCLHPCRRQYLVRDDEGNELKLQNKFVMSAKDLCTLPFIEKLKKAGIKALKIEGRNREPEYVSGVVGVYRKAIDKKLNENEIEQGIKDLNKVYTKGFSSGFFLKAPTSDDFAKQEHSSSTEKKEHIGRVEHYFSNKKVAIVKIFSGSLRIGDEIIILGKNIGMKRSLVNSMEIEHKPVSIAKKGQTIGLLVEGVKKGNEVYVVKKR